MREGVVVMADAEEVFVLRLCGPVLNGEALRAVVEALDDPRPHVIYLDLGKVRVPTAEGLGLLVRLNGGLRVRGGYLVLLNVTADAFEVFEVTRLVAVLDVRPLVAA
jgi:anti-anti-sigma factor